MKSKIQSNLFQVRKQAAANRLTHKRRFFEAKSALRNRVHPTRVFPLAHPIPQWDPRLKDCVDKRLWEVFCPFISLWGVQEAPERIKDFEEFCWMDTHPTLSGGCSGTGFGTWMYSWPFILQNLRPRPRETRCFFRGHIDRE